MYEHGDDVPQDHREAATWYTRAADQDNATALNVVGVLYATGKGVPKDPREAVMWYTRAAGQGHAKAQFSLALMLDAGRGAADHWYRLAAAQGHQQAQRMIDAFTVRPLPGPFDPYEPSTDDAVLIQRASERAAAAYCAAHQAARHAETTLDRAAQMLGRIVAAANVLDRHEQNRSAAYSRLYQTITNLDRTAERTNHRLQAIIKALKQRDKETIAIEARLRQTRRADPMPNKIIDAAARSAKASKTLDTMRARIVKADEARTEAAHQARAAQVAEAATEAATASREAAEAWDALATHAAKQAAECRHGAELGDRTRRRWAR